ncbi:MAG: spore coat U domain-containing protein [Pseudomonadota bacterium]|nr:spore coat U domain-containing protein [Pseudomonadota bacterium]
MRSGRSVRKLLFLLVFSAGLLSAGEARAQLTCGVSGTTVAFGTYSPASVTPRDSTGTVSVTCNALIALFVSFQVQLSTGGSGSYAARTMVSGANTLNYQLHTTALRNTVWGNGTGGTSQISFSSPVAVFPLAINYTVYGRIPALQTSTRTGSYTDTVTVTLIY